MYRGTHHGFDALVDILFGHLRGLDPNDVQLLMNDILGVINAELCLKEREMFRQLDDRIRDAVSHAIREERLKALSIRLFCSPN